MESPREIRPEQLPNLPTRDLVALFSRECQHMAKALRKDVRRRLGVEHPIPFPEFLQAACEFLTADPGDKPRSDWRREFIKRMEGLKNRLGLDEWGDLIDQQKWYFCQNISRIPGIVPEKFLTILCHDRPECFRGFAGWEQFVEKNAQGYEALVWQERRDTFLNSVIVIDLEYESGTGIKEVCYWHQGNHNTWHRSNGTDLNAFLIELEQDVDCRWLVGHNILNWDLPRLREYMACDFLPNCSVWDTLVVQTLLEPWLVSQALIGAGKAHEATFDVDATLRLFRQQVDILDPNFNTITEGTPDPLELVEKVSSILSVNPGFRRPPCAPDFLYAASGYTKQVLLPEAVISRLHWVPDIRFDKELWLLPTKQTERERIPGSDVMSLIAEVVIMDLACYAEEHHIDLLPTMLPAWIANHAPQLIGMGSLIKSSCSTSDGDQGPFHAGTYEALSVEQVTTINWSDWHEPFVELRQACLLRSKSPIRRPDYLQSIPEATERSRQVRRVPSLHRTSVAPGCAEDTDLWIEYHPARRRTDLQPWCVWDTTLCNKSPIPSTLGTARNRMPAKPRFRTPNLVHDHESLPIMSMASEDRFLCWSDLLLTVESILSVGTNLPAVHIMLLDEGPELGMAGRLFARLGWAPGFGRSKFQLLNSLKGQETGKCLVGSLRDALFWRKASEHCGVAVEFIIPELPLDRWTVATSSPPLIQPDNGADEKDRHARQRPSQVMKTKPWDDATTSTDALEDFDDPDDDDDAHHNPHVQILTDDEQEPEINPVDGFTHGDTFAKPEDYTRALDLILPVWANMLFHECQPWLLDQRVAAACHLGLCENVALQTADPSATRAILEGFRTELGAPEHRKADHSVDNYRRVLAETWGHADFKSETQLPAAQEISKTDRDVFVALPTGEGKSVLFQIPALIEGMASGKLSVVISPLRALMKDQVSGLRDKGFDMSVDYLTGDLDPWSLAESHQRILDGQTLLVYVAPERFRNTRFLDILRRRNEYDGGLGFVILDEAHCFWLWGLDFRPDYFHAVSHLRVNYRERGYKFPLLLFSATVTESVLSNVRNALHQTPETLVVTPDYRLHPVRDFLDLEPCANTGTKSRDRSVRLMDRCRIIVSLMENEVMDPAKSLALLFVQMRRQAEDCEGILASALPQWSVATFHAGMESGMRQQIYEDLKTGKVQMLAATKAFGMGMDLPNIHRCFHLSPPCFLEDYLQEVGRSGRGELQRREAGRDRVKCTVIWDQGDLDRNNELVTRNALILRKLGEIHSVIVASTYESTIGQKLAVVFPRRDLEQPTDTVLRAALGWLERQPLERIEIIQSLPHILELLVGPDFDSERVAAKDTNEPTGRILALIRDIVLKGLVHSSTASLGNRFLGQMLIANSDDPPNWRRLILSVSSLVREVNLGSLDEAYAILGQLIKKGVLKVSRNLEFRKGHAWEIRHELLQAGQNLLEQVRNTPGEHTKTFTRDRLRALAKDEMAIVTSASVFWTEQQDAQHDRYAARLVRAVLRSASAAWIAVKESTDTEGRICHQIELPSATRKKQNQLWKEVWQLAGELADECFAEIKSDLLPWDKLLQKIPRKSGWRRMQAALGVLGRLGLIHLEQSLNATAYLVRVLSDSPLVGPDNEPADDGAKKVDCDLTECNEFNRLRELAMELWLQIPDALDRQRFVDEYFTAADSRSLTEILTRWTGQLEHDSGALSDFLGKVRQEALDGELEKLEHGGEPDQFRACTVPFNQDLLVNAGPGAGKTRVLLMRAAHLIHVQKLAPEEILILAFNRAVVTEIKRRIRHLFDQMGYGAYVRRLQVYTFHSYAIKHLPGEWEKLRKEQKAFKETRDKDKSEPLKQLLKEFVQSVRESDDFAARASRGVKVILVDEFQDMDDDLFEILERLKGMSKASLMVIGDDDQDVLRWNRGGANPPDATKYFLRFRSTYPQAEVIDLKVNFRSDETIVVKSQNLLAELLGHVNRMKADIALKAKSTEPGAVEFFKSWEDGLRYASEDVHAGFSCAVLCRTNAEAATAYAQLKHPPHALANSIRLLGDGDILLSRLRHVAEMCDIAREDQELRNLPLDSGWQHIKKRFNALPIPEKIEGHLLSLQRLRDVFLDMEARGTLETWCEWLSDLHVSEAERILATKADCCDQLLPGLTVSTIHKVKGLEFDSVVLMPSSSRFTLVESAVHGSFNQVSKDSMNAESRSRMDDEARLYYVGFTRARRKAWLGWGPREKSWSKGQNDQLQGDGLIAPVVLSGSPEEVWLGYAAYGKLPADLQETIRQRVRIGAEVRLGAPDNNGRFPFTTPDVGRIGKLSSQSSQALAKCGDQRRNDMTFEVSAVCRWPWDPETNRDSHEFVIQRKWFYAVLLNGA